MSEIETAIGDIRAAAEKVGLPTLAREADVPYTTLHSFAERGWSNKNIEIVAKLAAAARRLSDPSEEG